MKRLLFFLLALSFMITAEAQNKKYLSSENSINGHCIGTGKQGHKLIESWGWAKKDKHAVEEAEKNAIIGIIFHGYPGTGEAGEVRPIIPIEMQKEVMDKNSSFFDDFFSRADKYLSFIVNANNINKTIKDKRKRGKGWEVLIVAEIRYDALRKYLESEGVIPKIEDILGNFRKPSLMIMPSSLYLEQNGFINVVNVEGEEIKLPDYDKLYGNDFNWKKAEQKIQELMDDRGFHDIKSFESALKGVKRDAHHIEFKTSKNGDRIAITPDDVAKRSAKADIIIEVEFVLHQKGPKKQIQGIVYAKDPYTDIPLASIDMDGTPSFNAPVNDLIKEAIIKKLDKFMETVQEKFMDFAKNGRKITVNVEVFEGFEHNKQPLDLETSLQFKGRTGELKQILNYWMNENTVNSQFNPASGSENFAIYEQVRIPLEYEDPWMKGKMVPMDAEAFGYELQNFLLTNFQIVSKVDPIGLGEVNVIIGTK